MNLKKEYTFDIMELTYLVPAVECYLTQLEKISDLADIPFTSLSNHIKDTVNRVSDLRNKLKDALETRESNIVKNSSITVGSGSIGTTTINPITGTFTSTATIPGGTANLQKPKE